MPLIPKFSFIHYTIALLVIGLTVALGLMLIIYSFKKVPKQNNFQIGCRYAAVALFSVGVVFIFERMVNFMTNDMVFVYFTGQILGALQVILISESILLLLRKTRTPWVVNVISFVLVLLVAFFGTFSFSQGYLQLFKIASITCSVLYVSLIVYYFGSGLKILSRTQGEVEIDANFKVSRAWLKSILLWGGTSTLLVLFMVLIPTSLFLLFLCFYGLFYGYYAITYLVKCSSYLRCLYHEDEVRRIEEKMQTDSLAKNAPTFSEIEMMIKVWVLEKKFVNPNTSIESLAKTIGSNRTYLSTYINSTYNQSFSSWINVLRIREAKVIMVNESQLTLEEIGERVGYSSKSYFSRTFYRVEGMTPSEWRSLNIIK